MRKINDAGFDGSVGVGRCNVIFRNGYDRLQLRQNIDNQPYNQFFWCKMEKMLLYRNSKGEFFEMKFEEIKL